MRFALLGLLASACRLTGTFECGLDEVCRKGDELGVCEVEGYCSFGDEDCMSRRRFADSAGDGLAGTCVSETAEPLTCRDLWRTNTVRFGAVEDLGVNSPQDDRDPWLAPAANFIWFSSSRGGTGADIYTASRADLTVPFSTPTLYAVFNSPQNDTRVSPSPDQLTAYISSNRSGTEGGSDVWRSTRTSLASTFSTPDNATVVDVNTSADEYDAALSYDTLHLYVSVAAPRQHLAVASRATPSDAFSVPATIVELDTGESDADPAPSPDELLLVFTSLRASPISGSNLWYSTRATNTEKWLPPRLVPDINIDGDEGDAFLSADGCTLYFARRPAPTAPHDLVYASVVTASD